MDTPTGNLRMTLSDVASLSRVQRPVVSMWRKRRSGTALPFPEAVSLENGLEMFDADDVAGWLAATGLGNNPEARNDVAAFARLSVTNQTNGPSQDSRRNVDGLTALLALKVLTGSALGKQSRDELLDAADECDPDDHFLYTELEALGSDLPAIASYADRLVDSAYSAPAAFETLLADRFRAGLRDHADAALTDAALSLVARAAIELAASLDGNAVFVDSTPGGSDVLLGIVREFGDAAPITLLTADDDGLAARLTRRRLAVHGLDSGQVKIDESGAFDVVGPAVHLAQFPSPGSIGISPAGMLSAVENTALQMDDAQRAVMIAPARVLCDALAGAAGGLRSDLLRSGRVRAIVRLPQGLLRSKPREAHALWVLGPSFDGVPIGERWTMVADLSTRKLTEDVSQDLISDVVASMGDRATIRAHSFRFARLVQTRVLLASRGSLVATPSHGITKGPTGGTESALRIEELVRILQARNSRDSAAPEVHPVEPNTNTQAASIEELAAAGNLRYINGNRLDDADLTPSAGTRILGTDELLNPHGAQPRFITLLDFAANYPAGRLTEPGDVVFCTSPRPAAIVDNDGGSAVVFPARVLRIDAGDPGGLVPDVVAADINSLPAADKAWRQWRLRRTPDAQRKKLSETLARLQHEQQEARERLKQLEELATLITDGVAGGSLTLTDPSTKLAAAPTEGTR
jgi:hypothetical protein